MLSNKINQKYLLRVEEYVKRNLDQHIVDPDDNLVYTKRKLHQMSGGFEVSSLSDSGDTGRHAPDVPKTGWDKAYVWIKLVRIQACVFSCRPPIEPTRSRSRQNFFVQISS